jgi:hypothetical protein
MAYDIGGMLARSGQTVGQAIGGGFADLGAGIGTGIGGMLTRRREKQAAQNAQQQFQQIVDTYQTDPAGMIAEAQKAKLDPDKNIQAMGDLLMAQAERLMTAQEKKVAGKTGRGKGELMALANNPKFDITDQKMQGGYFGMAEAYGVSREDAMSIALEAIENRNELGQDKKAPTYASVGDMFKDENNNVFTVTERRTGTGVELITQPVGHSEEQEGKLTPAGGVYGETAGERLGRGIRAAGEEMAAKEYSKRQQETVANLPKIEMTRENVQRSLELLPQLRTGGFSTALVRSVQDFLGEEPADQAEFTLLAGKAVLDNLSKFEGAITEGERQYLERLFQSVQRSPEANLAILENFLEEAEYMLADAEARANSSTYKEYLETRPSYSSSRKKEEGPKKVNFDDLK